MEQEEFSSKINDTYKSLIDLNNAIRALSMEEEKFYSIPAATTTEIQNLGTQITESYRSVLNKVQTLRSIVERMISAENDGSTETSLPSNEDAQNLLKTFIKGKVKMMPAPLRPYAGCHSWRLKNLTKGQFICHKSAENEYILMVVLSFENNECIAYDPTDLKSGFKKLEENSWVPLPTVIPEKATARWEFQKNAVVLALYPNVEDELGWTTVFYQATVISRPCDPSIIPGSVRGYDLDFSEDRSDIRRVPEQFVVKYPG